MNITTGYMSSWGTCHCGADLTLGVMNRVPTLSVVGGGVIGLAVAWRAAQAGWRVTVHDPTAGHAAPTASAAWVAGGMLTPVAEGDADDAGYELAAESLQRWPSFAAELAAASGRGSGLRPEGSLVTACTAAGIDELERLHARLTVLRRRTVRVDAAGCRQLEPMLGPSVLGGVTVPGDLAVDNRALLAALRSACSRFEVAVDARTIEDLADLHADQVVVATGAAVATLVPGVPVRPVKGEILRLHHRHGTPGPPTRTVRAEVPNGQVYLVPRDDGVVVGATVRDVGFDTDPTAGGVLRLLVDAIAVMPDLQDYALAESAAGLRPTTPDGLPLVGRLDDRTVLATGHGRNGLLLTPITADIVMGELSGANRLDIDLGPIRPQRFA